MSMHPSYAERFPLLDGIASFEELMGNPAHDATVTGPHLTLGVLHGFLNLPAEVEPVGHALHLIADAVAAPVPTVQESPNV